MNVNRGFKSQWTHPITYNKDGLGNIFPVNSNRYEFFLKRLHNQGVFNTIAIMGQYPLTRCSRITTKEIVE